MKEKLHFLDLSSSLLNNKNCPPGKGHEFHLQIAYTYLRSIHGARGVHSSNQNSLGVYQDIGSVKSMESKDLKTVFKESFIDPINKQHWKKCSILYVLLSVAFDDPLLISGTKDLSILDSMECVWIMVDLEKLNHRYHDGPQESPTTTVETLPQLYGFKTPVRTILLSNSATALSACHGTYLLLVSYNVQWQKTVTRNDSHCLGKCISHWAVFTRHIGFNKVPEPFPLCISQITKHAQDPDEVLSLSLEFEIIIEILRHGRLLGETQESLVQGNIVPAT
ncbi:hypothetical protein F5I97DRAFT_1827018 [Phlebopus sp. FC_14]|nr:hypothetical protein F5I97DRAFT_1827018 [Phlebopus sp. FC_14]